MGSPSKRETGDGNGASRDERESVPVGPQPSDATSALGTLAAIIGTLSAGLVTDDESKADATPDERNECLRACMEDAFALAQREIIQVR